MAKRQTSAKPGLTRKQISRAKREASIQRGVLIGVGVVAVIVIGLISFAIINEQVIKPRRVLANINGETITAAEFQDRVRFDYYFNYYLLTGGQQLPGFDAVSFNQVSFDSMINDILVEQKAAEMGITATEEEVRARLWSQFGYNGGLPMPTPTPLPYTPTATGPTLTPTLTPTFVYTLTPSPTPTLIPGTTPTPTRTPTQIPTATPEGTLAATSTPRPTATPMSEEAFNETYNRVLEDASQITGVPRARIEAILYAQTRALLLRERLVEAMNLPADETKIMIHAAHILVDTEEEARAALERIQNGELFEEVAAEVSRDTSNAYKGGDLGWFGPGEMVAEFEQAALDTPVGQVSEPVQTSFGWHLIKVYERAEVPTTQDEREQQQQETFRARLEEWRNEPGVVIEDFWTDYMVLDLP
jgi:parvulin-like peptidyl-prolyl isomerase